MEKLKRLQEGANVDELLENEIIEKSAEKVENEIQSIFRETEISKKPLVNGEEGEEICDNKDNGDENSTITGEISENITSSDPNSETNPDNKSDEIPPTIPLRKSKRKFLDVSTQTESLGLAECICCCTCGRSTPE